MRFKLAGIQLNYFNLKFFKFSDMASIVNSICKFTSICGVGESYGPHSYILQLDDFKFMLDCGWDTHREDFQASIKEKFLSLASDVDCIILSHPGMEHSGGLPLLYKILSEQRKDGKMLGKSMPPIYATVPVKRMGQLFVYDYFLNQHNNKEFTEFKLDDIDKVFESIIPLRNNQTVQLLGHKSNTSDIKASGIGSLRENFEIIYFYNSLELEDLEASFWSVLTTPFGSQLTPCSFHRNRQHTAHAA